MKNIKRKLFAPARVTAAVIGTAMTIVASSAIAGPVTEALTDGIDKADLLAGGAIILVACAVVAMIGLGRRLAK